MAAARWLGWARLAAVLTLAGLLSLPAKAGLRSHYFVHLSSAQGLAQNTVNALLQDSAGFVWVATQGGLHRYDGYQFLLLQEEHGQPEGLPESWINALAEAPDGALWIGSNSQFLVRMDRDGRMTRHRPPLPPGGERQRDTVKALRVGADGVVWAGTGMGVERYDPRTGERRNVLEFDSSQGDIRDYINGVSIEFASDGQLWSAGNAGVARIDPDSLQVSWVDRERDAFHLHRDGRGRLWVGSKRGLAEIVDRQIQPVATVAGGVRRIASETDGSLWLALLEGGLLRYQPDTAGSLRLQHQRDLPNGLVEPTASALLVDRSGLLWVGGPARGLAVGVARGARFPLWMMRDDSSAGQVSENVRSLFEDQRGALWIGLESEGLMRLDLASGSLHNRFADLAAALGSERARGLRLLSLAAAGAGALWVASDRGLIHYQPDTGSARLEQPRLADGRVLDGAVRSVLSTQSGALWLGTHMDGLWLRQAEQAGWQRIGHDPAQPNSLSHDLITCLFEDSRGRIWAGTQHGVNLIDPASLQVQRIQHDPARADSLPGNLVRAVLQAGDGRIHIATHSGLASLAAESAAGTAHFRRIGKADGLPSSTIYGVREDRSGKLWLSSNLGLTRLDPASGEVDVFGLQDGLQDLEFNGVADLALADGRLAFGGIRGLNVFDPLAIADSTFAPPLVLTSLRIGRHDLELVRLRAAANIELHFDERLLRLRFAALDYTASQLNRFRYQLEGFDPGWVDLGRSPELSFTNLDPGDYTLRVQASNHDGVWNPAALVLPLRVVPPWWLTWWARSAALLAMLATVYAGYRLRIRAIAQRQRILAARVAARTADLSNLAEIGQQLTASLDGEAVFSHLLTRLGPVLDAHVFAINLLDREAAVLRSEMAVEGGARLQPQAFALSERNRPAVWCVSQQTELVVSTRDELKRRIELPPVSRGEAMQSIVYLPLRAQGEVIGCLSVQSPRQHAYNDDQLRFLRTLTSYAAIALNNAQTYQRLKHSLDQLQRTQQQLLLSEKLAATGQLTAGVAHEINNPTNFAYVAAQNLEQQLERFRQFLHQLAGEDAAGEIMQAIDQRIDALSEQLVTILEGNRRVARIVQDLRTFARLDEAELKPVSVVDSLQSTLNLVATQYRERVDFVTDFEVDPLVECRPARLNQVFMNLIANACQSIEARQRQLGEGPDGCLTVSTRLVGDGLQVVFADNGEGMTPQVRERLFEPFFTTKSVGEGSGLGLSVSWSIVQEHGGRIEVESQPGEGTCMRVWLPLQSVPTARQGSVHDHSR